MKNLIAYNAFVQLLKNYFFNQTECQLNKIRNDVTDSILMLFSNILDMQGIPNYLNLFSDRAITREISKFRMSAYCLNIERGRYTKPKTPRNDRVCPHCTSVETETHFFTECQRYHTPRNKPFEYFSINCCGSYLFVIIFIVLLVAPQYFILTVPRRYFCCGSLLLLVLAVCIYTLVQLLC